MPRGNWIYEITSAASGGFVAPDAPPVTIGDTEHPTGYEVEEMYDGQFEVRIWWTPGAGSTPDNYKGVQVWLEDPDVSDTPAFPMDETVPLDGSNQMAGFWKPKYETDDSESPAVLIIDGKPADRFIRVYLLAFANVKNATLVRANDETHTPTPNIQIPIPAAAGSFVSGQEYAFFITDPQATVIEDFEHPDGAKYRLKFNYTKPDPATPLPPGMDVFGGVRIVYAYEDGSQLQGPFLEVDKPDTWISEMYDASTIQFRAYFCSVDITGRANTPVLNLTPSLLISVVYPPAGQGGTPDVTGFAVVPPTADRPNPRWEWQPDGTIILNWDIKWTPPPARRFAGVRFFVTNQPGPSVQLGGTRGNNQTSDTLVFIGYPATTTTYEVAAISVDTDGKLSDDVENIQTHTPRVYIQVGPPGPGGGGAEYAPVGTAGTVTTEQELNSDGVVMMRHKISGWTNPTDTKFGGMSIARVITNTVTDPVFWDAPKNATSFVTPWEPAPAPRTWDFYFVSRDVQEKRNSILPGVTPKYTAPPFTPIAGNVQATRLPKDWWNPAEFDWPEGLQFTAKQFASEKIYVGSILRVGGGSGTAASSFAGNANGQIVVYNRSNQMRAWMGEHSTDGTPDNTTPHSIYGGWFAELYVGGDNPTNAPLYATNQGVVIVGGFDIQGARFPYISVRRHDGVEIGRVGARIGQGIVGFDDPAYIAGAWFREFAVGGQSLADWRILCRRDPTNLATGADLVNMRNVNKFTIDYIQNYGYPATNPNPNAAMHLEFGYDAFVADATGGGYWKFPGIQLVRSGSSHGIRIINRGIVLDAPKGAVRRVALVTYNGDPQGSDTFPTDTFWGELTMSSPSSNIVNVELASGDQFQGGSYFRLYDGGNIKNFGVDQFGNVIIRGTLDLGGKFLKEFRTAGDISANSFWVGDHASQVISPQGQFVGAGGVYTLGAMESTGGMAAHDYVINFGTRKEVISPQGMFNGPGGVNTTASITGRDYYCGSTYVLNTLGKFVGAGVDVGTGAINAKDIATPSDGSITAGRFFCQFGATLRGGASGSFVAGGKTIEVSGGIITNIV